MSADARCEKIAFHVRVDSDLHRQAKMAAKDDDVSLNTYVVRLIRADVRRRKQAP